MDIFTPLFLGVYASFKGVLRDFCYKFQFSVGDRRGPFSNHNQLGGAGLGVPKAHPQTSLIGGRAHSIILGSRSCLGSVF